VGFYLSFLCSPRLCFCGNRWPPPGCTAHGQNSRARVFDGRCVVLWGGVVPVDALWVIALGSITLTALHRGIP
jgi:hypothetical protein